MEDDQCTFDELMTLLDEDSEGEAGSGVDKGTVAVPVENEEEDTSDDDIDDDELDRLATLVEEEENQASTNSQRDLKDVKIKESTTPKSPLRVKQEPGTETDPEEKMRLMEERIKLLEAQLVDKSRPEPSISSQATPPRPKNSALTTPARPSPTSKNYTAHVSNNSASTSSERTKFKPEPSSSKGNEGYSKNNSGVASSTIKKEGKARPPSGSFHDKSVTSATKSSGGEKKPVSIPKPSIVPRQLKDLEIDLFGVDTSPPASPTSECTPSGGKHTIQETPTSQHCKKTPPAFKTKTSVDHQVASLTAALQDDDSDWDDLDGEQGGYLDKPGKEINRLLKGKDENGKRVAHTASHDTISLTNRTPTWGSTRPKLSSQGGEQTVNKKAPPEDVDVTHDPFSGIRMVKPLVSSTQMKLRMDNRRMVKLSTLHTKSKASLEGDWVTIGVLVSKSDPKVSQKGNQYSIWTLSDLADCDHPVKVFLFGESHKTHWKTGIGMVTGILNPSILPNTEKYQNNSNEVCLTADHPQKLMLMGTSKDLGFCKAKTKAGRQCTAFINKQQGEFCAFHVQSAYKKTSAKRSELQAGHTGVTPRSFEQRIIPKGQTVTYGGQMFSTMNTGAANGKKSKQVSMNSLVKYDSAQTKGKLTTLSLHELLPEDRKKLMEAEELKEQKDAKAFHDILATPTVGSLNFVKHLIKTDGSSPGASGKEKAKVQSIKPGELLKKHQKDIQQQKKSFLLRKMGQQQQKGQAMIDLDEPVPTTGSGFHGNILNKTPQLGRGLMNGKSPLRAKNDDRELAKRKAIFKVQSEGGLNKHDPNAMKKVKNNDFQDKIRKRLAENSDNTESDGTSTSGAEPPKKRSRLLGDLDLDDPEVKKLLKAKSKHAHKLTEIEEEKQEAYFQVLEKKEAMEQKMASIYSMKTKAVTCRQCKYTALSALQSCRDQRHSIVTHDAVKRFFECKDCKARCTALDRYPSHPCAKCGGRSFGKAPMMKEKKGPKLPGQELLLRGEEVKNLNSLN